MNDDRTILDLEARLARAFHADGLPPAPASLLDRLDGIPDAAVRDGQRVRPSPNRRTAFWLVGLAALLAVGGVVALGGGRATEPIPPAPSGPLDTVVTYQVQWTAATPFDAATLAREVAVVQRRLERSVASAATARSEGTDRILVTIPGGVDPDPVRQIVGPNGIVTFVPLGTTSLAAGDPIDPAAFPALFGSEGIADARLTTNPQANQRVLQFDLTPAAAALFGDYTAAHINQYFAIVVDGLVLSAPVIQSAIPGGRVEISQSSEEGGYPLADGQRLVAILAGPLPVTLVEVSNTIGPTPRPAPTASAEQTTSPEPILASFELERIIGDVGCDTIIPPYAGFSLQIDPTADHPVLAATETGLRLPVLWGSEFRGNAGPPAVVVDARGFAYESSTFVAVRGVAVPALGDHFVCPAPDAVYIFNEPPPS